MKKELIIEVRGIGFPNKGAELMLVALIDQLKSRYSHVKFTMAPNASYEQRSPHGLLQLAKVTKYGFDFGILFRLLPRNLRRIFGIILPSEVDVIIDASGFAYGDQWGAKKANERLASNIEAFKGKRDNRRVIMLPQAFGPFEDKALQAAMQKITRNADLVFAREARSFQFLTNVSDLSIIQQAPDFTNGYHPKKTHLIDQSKFKVCFIVNQKMIAMKKNDDGNDYKHFMVNLLKKAVESSMAPFLLLHEGVKDKKLAQEVIEMCGSDVPMIVVESADEVKSVIGQCELVISSRFHGLVSALSQDVPVMATGWSHKYQMLLDDYGVSDMLYNESTDIERATVDMINLIQDSTIRNQVMKSISENNKIQKNRTVDMWSQVYDVIDGIE
jgi:colanic acid/amylovoran biosynthesis protein